MGARSANLVEWAPFRLTHGDITMLSGDYFDPRDTVTKDGIAVPILIRCSASPGRRPPCREE
jgi:hypothetical protein